MSKPALWITVNGDVNRIDLSDDSLGKLQAAVGGYVQAVDIGPYTMWLDEEGKMKGKPANVFGTFAWHSIYGPTDVIVGDVVVTGPSDRNGDLTALDEEAFAAYFDNLLVAGYDA